MTAANFLKAGGILLYPTETFYAIGCLGCNNEAANAILRLKKRCGAKPLPLLAGSPGQASLAADFSVCPPRLASAFWPGPLAVILPALEKTAIACRDASSRCAIRATSAQSAASLARLAGFPLTASSANYSGQPPASAIDCLDKYFLAACAKAGCGIALWREDRSSPLPSTIVEPVGPERLRVIRVGAIDKKRLAAENFTLEHAT